MYRFLRSALFSLPAIVATAFAVPIEVTYTDAPGTGFFDETACSPVGGNNGNTIGQRRRIAFEYAAKRWSEQISGTIPIKIQATCSTTLPAGTPSRPPFLASARPAQYLSNGAAGGGPLPLDDTFYPSALANQLSNEDNVVGGTRNDIVVNCNDYYDSNGTDATDLRRWYYGLDGNPRTFEPDSEDFDFVSTVLHEIGHGLGFVSHIGTDGSYLAAKPSIWNRLMKNGAGTDITSLNQSQRAAATISGDVFIASPNVVLYNNGNPAKVYSPNPLEPGSSMSHFDEATYSAADSLNELMTPASSFGSHNFGPLAMNALRDMGYSMLDQLPPTVGIDVPVPGKSYRSNAINISGSAIDTSSQGSVNAVGLLRVKVALSNASAQYYNWGSGSFSGTVFNHGTHVKNAEVQGIVRIPTGSKNWTTTLPAGLPDGFYQIHIAAVDQLDQGSTFVASSFTIDNSSPLTQVEPWLNNAIVFNLDGFRIYSPEAQTVEVEIRRLDGGTTWYWTGTNWSTTPFTLPTTGSAGRWTVNATLPGRNNWNASHPIVLFARATDAASNPTATQIQVTRTAADTTAPVVTLSSPANGTVLSTPSIPSIAGTAGDPESGIGSLTLTLSRFLPGGGVDFWNGASWGGTAVQLPVHQTPGDTIWTAPYNWNLPSGSSLPNGAYSLQITATNKESPAATVGVGRNFSVDYHPVYTWTGWTMRDSNHENNSNSWGTPENWSPYGVPDVNDIAVIDNGDEVTSTISRSVYGLKLHSGYLNFLNGPGPLGTVTTSKASEWTGGTLRGIWDVASGATLQLSGSSGRVLSANGQLRNAGTVTWTGGVTQGYESATITNLPGGVWVLGAAEDAFNNFYGGNQFINQGTLRQTVAGNVIFNDWTLTLGGEIQKQGGTLVTNTNVTLPPGTAFSGNGGFRHESWTLGVSGTITNPTGIFEIAGGGFGATAPAVLSGNYRWSGGAWGGTFTVPSGSDLSIVGDCQLNAGTVLNNSGTVHWNSAYPLRGYEAVTVNNLAGGIWRLETTGHAFSNFYGGNAFNNAGLMEKTGADETLLTNWTYAFSGQTKVAAGQLTVAANSSMAAGTLLSGAGTLDFNAGTCSLNGGITSTTTTLRQSGGVMVAAAGALIQGNWKWTGGSISGSLEIPVSRQLVIDGSCQFNTGATLANKGTVVWQGGIPVTGYENVTVTNHAGATWEFASEGDAFNRFYGNNQFFNQGLLKRSAANGEVILNDWTYHHSGTFNASAGSTQVHATINLLAGASFTGAGAFSFHADTVLKGATTFTAQSSVAGGSFWGEETGLIHGTLLWSSATFRGLTKVAPGAFLRLVTTGGKALSNNSIIDNAGEVVWADGDLQGVENSSILTRSGGFFRIEGGGSFTNFYGNNHLVIDDGGSLTKTNSAENAISWHFDNDGAATVNAGLLSLHNGGSGDGSFTGTGSGVLRFANGAHVLEGGASLSGATEITGGSLIATGNAGGRIDLKGGSTGGAAPAVFSFANGSTWTEGSIVGLASVPNGSSLTAGGAGFKGLGGGAALTVGGLLQWNGGSTIQGYDNTTIDVATGGVIRVTADGDLFSNFYGGNRLLLSGTFEKTAGMLATLLDEWLVQGGGTLRAQTGSIDLHTTVNLLTGTKFEGAAITRFTGGTTTVSGTATIQAGSTVNFAGASIVGHEDGSGGFSGGAIQWSGGWLSRTLTLSSTTTLNGVSEKVIGVGSVVRNAGIMTVDGSGQLTGYDNSELRNQAGGTLHFTGTCHLGNFYGNNRVVNEGTVTLGSPHARQTMNWTFRQLATGTLAIQVGGENSATPDFDILQGSGGFELAGKLVVTKSGGYAPAQDTIFTFLNGSGVSGTFATVQASGFAVEYSGGSALLRAGNTGLGFEAWAASRGLNGINAQSGADPDRDGVTNFLEYAFNTDPSLHSPNPVSVTTENIGGQKWITIRYRRWQDRVDAGLSYLPRRSSNLSTWDSAGIVDEADPAAAPVAGSEARRCRVLLGSGKNFMRLNAE